MAWHHGRCGNNMLNFFKDKKVLITGHTGFKGSWLTRALVLAGAKVTGYSLNPPTKPSMFEILELDKDINSVIGDIRDLDKLSKVFKEVEPEFVIHMAAQPIVRTSYEEPVYTYETNVMGTVNILECVRNSKSVKSFLNVTTDKVYDNKEWDRGYVEEDYLDGYDPYSNSKSCSELVTHSYKRSFFKDRHCAISTARAGNVIGGGDFAKDRIIPDCFRAASELSPVILRHPESIRPFQHVLEPIYIYLMILKRQFEYSEQYEGSFNVGPNDEDCINTGELVALFSNAWKDGFSYEIQKDERFHEAGFLKLNCDKLKIIYGWDAKYTIKTAVEKTVEWYKAYLSEADMREITDKQIREFFIDWDNRI